LLISHVERDRPLDGTVHDTAKVLAVAETQWSPPKRDGLRKNTVGGKL
jgi:hypothetical protein